MTIAPPKPEPMDPPTSMNPLGGSSPATSGACSLSSAPAPRHAGAWAFAAGLILALQLRRRRRA